MNKILDYFVKDRDKLQLELQRQYDSIMSIEGVELDKELTFNFNTGYELMVKMLDESIESHEFEKAIYILLKLAENANVKIETA